MKISNKDYPTRGTEGFVLDASGKRLRLLKKVGWKAIPNVVHMTIIPGKVNEELAKLGCEKQFGRRMEVKPGDNKKYNKYMAYMIRRLESRKGKPRQYFNMVWKILNTSKVFRLSAWNRVCPEWPMLNINKIDKTDKKITQIFRTWSYDLRSRRVYIPKGPNDYRPLGVPALEWRVALHMVNNFLFQFVREKLGDSQHGFIKGKGTLTAWKAIMEKLDNPYIYECDLKQFFPQVKHKVIERGLKRLGVETSILNWLMYLSSNVPILPKKRLLDETLTENKKKIFIMSLINYWLPVNKLLDQSGYIRDQKWDKLSDLTKWQNVDQYGTTQGSPISPLVSIIGMKETFLDQQEHVAYADDPVFFGRELFEIKSDEENGLVIHPDKSGWVVKDGKKLKPLKFLGIEYDITTGNMRNKTRTPKPFQLSHKQCKDLLLAIGKKPSGNPRSDWLSLLRSKIGGVVLNALHNGGWDVYDCERKTIRLNMNSWYSLNNLSVNSIHYLSTHASSWWLTRNRKIRRVAGRSGREEQKEYLISKLRQHRILGISQELCIT